MKRIIIFIAILFSVSYSSYGLQNCGPENPCKPGKTCFEGQCRNDNAPPPPGLVIPIDNHSPLLVLAGLGLGIYLLRIRKTV